MLVSGGGIALAYDPLLRMFQASTTRWAYDGATMIAEYNSSNALLRRFVHGPGIDEPLVWYEGTGLTDRRFLHADERGSIIAVSDGAGAVLGTNRYDEYGMPESPVVGRFHYTGQPYISSLGLYHYRARFYNPNLGRFMQTDPIGYGDGMNLYAYVGGDPVNAIDPSGTECQVTTGSRTCREDGSSLLFSCVGACFGGGGGGSGGSGTGGSGSGGIGGGIGDPAASSLLESCAAGNTGCGSLTGLLSESDDQGETVFVTASRDEIYSSPLDVEGFFQITSVVIGGIASRGADIYTRGLRRIRLITRFIQPVRCGNARAPCSPLNPLGGSYEARFLTILGRVINGHTIIGNIGPAFPTMLSVPPESYRFIIVPNILTPGNTQVLIRGQH